MINYLSKLNNPFTVLSVQEVSKDLNIGINQAYDLFKQEDFPSIKIGRKFWIKADFLNEFLSHKRIMAE